MSFKKQNLKEVEELIQIPNRNSIVINKPLNIHPFKNSTSKRILKHSSFVLSFLATLSVVILLITTGWLVVPYLVKQHIYYKMTISPEANPELYDAWIHPPVPVYSKVYIFNVTNPDGVTKGELPKFVEVGPYVFTMNRTKIGIKHDDLTDTVTYKEHISYQFQEELSGSAKLTDVVTIINVPFVAAAIQIAQDFSWPMNEIAKLVLLKYKEPIFIQKTAEEALFKGWKVPFLEAIEEETGVNLFPNNTFGLMIGQNDTSLGPFTISRGTYDKSSFANVVKYQNKTRMNVWGDDPTTVCNKIEGTDGTIFPTFRSKTSRLKFFNSELCRSFYFTFNETVKFEGISGFRFKAPQLAFMDPKETEENQCICDSFHDEPGKCLAEGAFNLAPCKENAPVAASLPYFLDAAPKYVEKSGLVPNREKHESFVDVEPITGVVLQASNKGQVNLILTPVKEFSFLRKLPDMLFPLVWAEQYAQLDEALINRLKTIFFFVEVADIASKWGSITISLVLLAGWIYLHTTKRNKRV